MAKKRGGIAGIWDRNKKIINPIATTLAGIVGTPALGAAVGAAMGGLDRPGKSGIGVDLGGALKGGVSGYAAGGMGNALKHGVIGGLAEGSLGAGIRQGASTLPGLGALGKVGSVKAALPALVADGGGDGSPGGGFKFPSLGKIGDGIKDAVTGNGGMNALAFAQLMNSAGLGKKSGDMADYAFDTQKKLFADKEGLRSGGIAGMTAPRTELPQLGKLGAVANPFARNL